MASAAFYISGIALGLAGSLHCIGMCGPLMLSLPLSGFTTRGKTIGLTLYHTGRIISYALLGLVCGLLGAGVMLAGYQQALTIFLGALIVLYYAWRLMGYRIKQQRPAKAGVNFIQPLLIRFLSVPSFKHFLLAGLLNGLLPCGMVYLALASALAVRDMGAAAGFMAAFGLGTVPLMVSLYVSGQLVPLAVRNRIRKAIPYFAMLVGALLILRGLNLGIPYLSPAPMEAGAAYSCH